MCVGERGVCEVSKEGGRGVCVCGSEQAECYQTLELGLKQPQSRPAV